ncbi:glycosyltransferase family 2 protein [Nonlabens sp.]|uniref:glycosyltransferase family 2 protein n=1 Tax=Nonlabens sp. TaxID=1888209 RepID=UPI003F69A824
MKPLISIIIPSYNRATLISETLSSIVAQTYENWECLVIDDGSTDDTVEVVAAFAKAESRISIHTRPATLTKGANACRNYGYQLSKGEYILFYDSDDAMLPFKLESHLTGFKKHREIDGFILNSAYYNFKTANAYRKWRPQLWSDHMIRDFLLQKAGWQTGDVLWKKTSLDDLSFSQDLHSYQDYYFYATALISGKRFKYNDIVASHIRHTPASIKLTKNRNTLLSEWKARFNTVHQLLRRKVLDKELATALLPSLYNITEQIAAHREYRYLLSSLMTIYKLSVIANKRFQFFKMIMIIYPLKLL